MKVGHGDIVPVVVAASDCDRVAAVEPADVAVVEDIVDFEYPPLDLNSLLALGTVLGLSVGGDSLYEAYSDSDDHVKVVDDVGELHYLSVEQVLMM